MWLIFRLEQYFDHFPDLFVNLTLYHAAELVERRNVQVSLSSILDQPLVVFRKLRVISVSERFTGFFQGHLGRLLSQDLIEPFHDTTITLKKLFVTLTFQSEFLSCFFQFKLQAVVQLNGWQFINIVTQLCEVFDRCLLPLTCVDLSRKLFHFGELFTQCHDPTRVGLNLTQNVSF